MNQKIIAAALALLLVAATFSACGKKKDTIVAKNGKEYEAVTDEQGNLQYDPEGDVYVYQTDDKGNYVKDENGEKQKVAVKTEDTVVKDNDMTVETEDYRFTFDRKGWALNPRGTYFLENSNDMVIMQVNDLGVPEEGSSLQTEFQKHTQSWQQTVDEYNQNHSEKASYKAQELTLTPQKTDVKIIESFVTNDKEETLSYMFMATFAAHGKIFQITLYCNDPAYYKPDEWNLVDAIDKGLYLK